MAHDASTGFHDIKALPGFYPFPWHVVYAAALVALIVGALLLITSRRRKRIAQAAYVPPVPPHQLAIDELQQIEHGFSAGTVSLRDAGTRASLALRSYISAALAVPAAEMTNRELLGRFSADLRRTVPGLTGEQTDQLRRTVESLLKAFEWITFSDLSDARYASDTTYVAKRLNESREFVNQLHYISSKAEVFGETQGEQRTTKGKSA